VGVLLRPFRPRAPRWGASPLGPVVIVRTRAAHLGTAAPAGPAGGRRNSDAATDVDVA
jgi:hypothetical protein